jgi:hypothetical protein
MNRLAMLPAFFGEFENHSKVENRLNYLLLTISSLVRNFDIVIGVYDKKDLEKIPDQLKQITIVLNCDPLFIPSTLVDYCKENLSEYEYYLFTDSDQYFSVKCWKAIEEKASDYQYLSPHRLEKIYMGCGSERGEIVTIENIDYVCPNSQSTKEQKNRFYEVDNLIEAYGGAYFLNSKTFSNINFSGIRDLPIEHQAGFDLFNQFRCFKTSEITEFFVYHLSGYEYHQRLYSEKYK